MTLLKFVWTSGLLFSLIPSVAALACNQALLASINHGAPLRVLPLGDSITYGYNEPSGNSYRRDVECLLYAGGNPVSLIGSIKNGNWDNNESDAFIYHTIDEILEAGAPELTRQTSKPNVILMHAGTVNFALNQNVTNASERLGHLIDFITEQNPDTLLVVSQLIPNRNATLNALIDTYNDAMPAVVAARARAGKRVIMTSMHGVTPELLLSDGTHPSERGSRVMARRFYEAVVEAGRRGMVVAAEGAFTDSGASSLPPSGKCSDLKD